MQVRMDRGLRRQDTKGFRGDPGGRLRPPETMLRPAAVVRASARC